MTSQHLAKAREFIAIAESTDAKREAYIKAADEIIAARAEGWGDRAIARELGRDPKDVRTLIAWATTEGGPPQHLPYGGPENTKRSHRSVAGSYLGSDDRTPEEVAEIIGKLPPARRAQVAAVALSTPEAIDAAVADPKVARKVAAAGARVSEGSRERAQRRDREMFPQAMRNHDQVRALGLMVQARYRMREALRHLLCVEDLSDEMRGTALEMAGEVAQATGWVTSYLESGARGFEKELEALLADEDSR